MTTRNHHSNESLRPAANQHCISAKSAAPPVNAALAVTRTGKPKAPPPKLFEPPQSKAAQLFQGQRNPKKQRKIQKLDQWVEIRIVDGKTITTLYPSNEGLIKRGQRLLPAPEYVYRRLNFPDGIPDEYAWTFADPEQREYGGCGIQRMTVDTWLNVIDREKEDPDGHIGPTGVGNLPRPAESGECECPVCTENSRILANLLQAS